MSKLKRKTARTKPAPVSLMLKVLQITKSIIRSKVLDFKNDKKYS